MSALHKATSIYVDFEEVIAKTDEFVCTMIYNTLKNDEKLIDNSIIKNFFDIMKRTGEDYIPSFVDTKTSLNPFVDIADISESVDDIIIELKQNGMSDEDIKYMLCDQIYDDVITHDYKSDIAYMMHFTHIADSIKVLLKDKQLEKIYVYVKINTPFIHSVIFNFFMESDKVTIVTGDKENFFKSCDCDTYIFKDIRDIQFLPTNKHKDEDKSDVIMLSTQYNMDYWMDMKDDNDKYVSHNNIKDLYNVEVSMIK